MSSEVKDYFDHHLWLPIVIAVGGVALIILAVTLVILVCRYRRSRRRHYARIQNDMGVFEAMELHRQTQRDTEKETELYTCRFYLRSSLRYSLVENLLDIGSMSGRSWFTVKQDNPLLEDHMMLTLTPRHSKCLVDLPADKKTLNELFSCLQHPFLQPMHQLDYIPDRALVVEVQLLSTRGSLRDLIYRANPFNVFTSKYTHKGTPLPEKQIALFGRQILEAMVFLYDKGISPILHIHSGNVIVYSQTLCRLTGYHNGLLGYRPQSYAMLKSFVRSKEQYDKQSLDILMFGRMVFEMSAGYNLPTPTPQPQDIIVVKRKSAITDTLLGIFSSEESDDGLCSCDLHTVLQMPFFQQHTPPELAAWTVPQVPFSAKVETLLHNVKTATTLQQTRKPKKMRQSSSSRKASGKYPVSASPTSLSAFPATSEVYYNTTPSRPAPPTKKSAKPSTPSTKKPASSKVESRGALLGAIRKGNKLKITVTNDRSAPKL